MEMNGINRTKFKSPEQQLIPFENKLLKKLAFSKIVEATMSKSALTSIFRLDLMGKIKECIQREFTTFLEK
jgi:hypothetical protein